MDGVHARERNREMVWTKEGGDGWVDGWTRVEGKERVGDKRLRKPENRLSMMQGNQRN